ncbi:MAG: universal stress protein [Anaerolineaceae bacterium]|nr:universal stress protein [Anaerolineaceae bacterium]
MFNHILVPLDGSLLAECTLPHIAAFALTSCAKVTLLQVLDQEITCGSKKVADPLDWAIRKAEAEVYLENVCDRLRKAGLQASTAIIEGRAADGIINYGRDHKVDLISLSSHGLSGLSGWNISSVVQKVLYRTQVSSLIIPAYRQIQMDLTDFHYQKVFVGLDGSQRAEWVLPEALELIAFHHASLLLAHVISRPIMPYHLPRDKEVVDLLNLMNERNRLYAEIYLEELCSRLPADLYNIKSYLVMSENSIDALRDLAEQESADLVILSAHGGSGGYKRLYGSVALSFISYCTTPMLILQDLNPAIIMPTLAEIATVELPQH